VELAHGLAEGGAHVVIGARRLELLEQVAGEVHEQHGVEALAVRTDVTSEQDVVALVGAAVEAFGQLDILVNNAGVTLGKPLLEHTVSDWQQVIDVNLTASFVLAREAARVMVPRARVRS
jgi:gluconate 5-dehydrogenase